MDVPGGLCDDFWESSARCTLSHDDLGTFLAPRPVRMCYPWIHLMPSCVDGNIQQVILLGQRELSSVALLLLAWADDAPCHAAEHFVERTDVQCLHRWQKVLNPELIKGPWSPEVCPQAQLMMC